MKTRTIVLLFVFALLLVVPTLLQSDRVDKLEEDASVSDVRAEQARQQRDALEQTVSTLAGDVEILQGQLNDAGVEPATPSVEERLDEAADAASQPPGRIIERPSQGQVNIALQVCAQLGWCQGEPGTDGQPGQDGQDGADGADAVITDAEIQAAIDACFASGACVAPQGPEGPQGPAGQDGQDGLDGKDGAPGPSVVPGEPCGPDGYSWQERLIVGEFVYVCAQTPPPTPQS